MTAKRWARDPVRLTIDCLAAYRITRLLTTDDLPPIVRARNRLTTATERLWPDWASVWTCPWCLGFHVAWVTVLGRHLAERTGNGDRWTMAVLPWAVAAVVGAVSDREVH